MGILKLFNKDANPTIEGTSALMIATTNGHTEVVELLLIQIM